MRRGSFVFFLIISLLLLGCLSQRVTVHFEGANVSVLAEKADTPETIGKGLMFRKELRENEGMLFYMGESAYHAFWMVNTKIPLEAIFIDRNLTIVDIQEMEPCADEGTENRMPNCTIYISQWPSYYVLEVNQNFSMLHGIREGDRIEIR